jgi:hypothetical protein
VFVPLSDIDLLLPEGDWHAAQGKWRRWFDTGG